MTISDRVQHTIWQCEIEDSIQDNNVKQRTAYKIELLNVRQYTKYQCLIWNSMQIYHAKIGNSIQNDNVKYRTAYRQC
jgi:hypothetical protein